MNLTPLFAFLPWKEKINTFSFCEQLQINSINTLNWSNALGLISLILIVSVVDSATFFSLQCNWNLVLGLSVSKTKICMEEKKVQGVKKTSQCLYFTNNRLKILKLFHFKFIKFLFYTILFYEQITLITGTSNINAQINSIVKRSWICYIILNNNNSFPYTSVLVIEIFINTPIPLILEFWPGSLKIYTYIWKNIIVYGSHRYLIY